MFKSFFKHFDSLTIAVGASLLGITLVAILAINHVFVDRLLLKDAQSLTHDAASHIHDELFSDNSIKRKTVLADAITGQQEISRTKVAGFKTRSLSHRPEITPSELSHFEPRRLEASADIDRFIQENTVDNTHLSELKEYAIYTPSGQVYLPGKLFDSRTQRKRYSDSYKIVNHVRSVFASGSKLYTYREKPSGSYTQHFHPIVEKNKLVAVIMFEATKSEAGIKVARAVTNAVSLTAIAGLPIIVLVIYLAWSRLRESVRAQEEINYLELHDPLTDLPNRAGFHKVLNETIEEALQKGEHFAIFSLDLDGFHQINDALGHDMGDDILRTVVTRLYSYKPLNATMARLSGDEFGIILPDVATAEEASQLAKVFLEELAAPHNSEIDDVICTASIGVEFGPTQGVHGGIMLKNAKLALYRAKEDGGNTFRFFEPDMDKALQERRMIESNLAKAIKREEFVIYYQPQVDLSSREIIGYEALLRWNHPELGMISPASFIPILEETRMIVEVGEYVLERACREALQWHAPHKLAVNLSPVQFEAVDIAEMTERVLSKTGFPPERLELEITESVLMTDTDIAIEILNRLKQLGVHIAMDDFGTGYSSLSYISEFDFDKIKIDRSFVTSIQTDERARAIVTTIIGLGRALDITITAEGIETSDQLLLIQAAGCHYGQGYLFGKPMPLSTIISDRDDDGEQTQVA